MSNLKISQLPDFTGSTAGSWLIANNAAESETFKIERENFLNGYAPSSDLTALSSSIAITDLNQNNTIETLATTSSLTALSSSIAITDLNQNNAISALASSGSLTALSSSIALTDLNQNNTIATLATTSSLTSLSSSIAVTDLNQNNTIATLATTSSLTALSSSIATTDLGQNNRLTTIEGRYATTGSNTFIGNQIITGSVSISGSTLSLFSSGSQPILRVEQGNFNQTASLAPNSLSIAQGQAGLQTGSFLTQNTLIFQEGSTRNVQISFDRNIGLKISASNNTPNISITGSLFASGSSHRIIGNTQITGSLYVSASLANQNNVLLANANAGGGTNYLDAAGNYLISRGGPAHFVNNAIIAYNGGGNLITGSYNTIQGPTTLTGSLDVTGSITGSADGTFNGVKIGRGLGNLSSNTIVSRNAFGNNTTGTLNTIVGDTNLGLSATGSENTIIGWNNMNAALNANSNIAIGTTIMRTSVSPGSNIAIGRNNLEYNISGSNNVSVGLYSMQYSTGSRNVAVGESALNRALNDNIGIGYNAGEYETGSSKLYIDSVDRADLNSAISGSIIYGEMNSVVANQKLRLNAQVSVSNGLSVSGSLIITGSVGGNVTPLTITSNTASLDLSKGTFYTLQLVAGTNTLINPTNIQPGYTINILVNTTGSATVSFPSSVKQISGSAYVPSANTTQDILTLISFDSSSLFVAGVKNLV